MGHFGLAREIGSHCAWNLRSGDRYSECLTLTGLLVTSALKLGESPVYTQKSM